VTPQGRLHMPRPLMIQVPRPSMGSRRQHHTCPKRSRNPVFSRGRRIRAVGHGVQQLVHLQAGWGWEPEIWWCWREVGARLGQAHVTANEVVSAVRAASAMQVPVPVEGRF
jgi:hypothetical protein